MYTITNNNISLVCQNISTFKVTNEVHRLIIFNKLSRLDFESSLMFRLVHIVLVNSLHYDGDFRYSSENYNS